MSLLLGTEDGVYLALDDAVDDAERVIETDRVMRVREFGNEVYAASKSGLYRSRDSGDSWRDLGVPREEVYSVLVSPDSERLYAGTHPAHLFVSDDDGSSWRELDGFQELPSREEWFTPRHRNEAHIRSLGAHTDAPDRVIAGVEVGGVHISDDRGQTWMERREGVQDDVHHVLVVGPDEYLVSCGDGLYRTTNAGNSWTRLDEDIDHRYFRESILHNDRLYTAAARSSPGTWNGTSGADGALFVADEIGAGFRSMDYPGQPQEVVLAWTTVDATVIAGTNDGRVLIEGNDGWESAGHVPASIRSLCAM